MTKALSVCEQASRHAHTASQHPLCVALSLPSCPVLHLQCEAYTYDKGRFNLVLTGAAFMDRELMFEAYAAPENKQVSRPS